MSGTYVSFKRVSMYTKLCLFWGCTAMVGPGQCTAFGDDGCPVNPCTAASACHNSNERVTTRIYNLTYKTQPAGPTTAQRIAMRCRRDARLIVSYHHVRDHKTHPLNQRIIMFSGGVIYHHRITKSQYRVYFLRVAFDTTDIACSRVRLVRVTCRLPRKRPR